MIKKRYLISFDINNMRKLETDTLVIGSGVAGLRAAIEAVRYGKVLIVTKDRLQEGNTFRAQGGIAVVMSQEDTYEKHIQDTLKVGNGLSNEKAVRILVEEGPERIRELIKWGANFDKKDGKISFTKEGGHSVRRIIHARGDATGEEVEKTLILRIQENDNISILEDTFAIDLVCKNGECFGVIVQLKDKGRMVILAKKTILATGGIGQVYRETTNSSVATGDGMAMAYRAGAELMDMEFVQFHPTTLYIAGASRALISEVVRGEGGLLRNRYGERFMEKYHKMGELAPRDVVSKGILQEMKETEDSHVYLDLTHLDPEFLEARFPNIMSTCASFGIDIKRRLIPVRPTAHYMIGGIKIDIWGKTNIQNLYACGEVACSGLHGANRLGSNSLLEGLVFGYRAGYHAGKEIKDQVVCVPDISNTFEHKYHLEELDIEDVRRSLNSLMWRDVGIERKEEGLLEAGQKIDFWCSYVMNREFPTREGLELQNMLTVAKLVQEAAWKRKESRGVHYRTDYPKKSAKWRKHISFLSTEVR
ncbi:MAG: L-aspartate oxidase [bacterium]|nr:L-aspartate oxidase [bacterium]